MATSFYDDLEYSEEAKFILKEVYQKICHEGRYVFINKGDKYRSLGSENIQKEFCVDTIAQISEKESILVEEKFRKVDYGDLLVETDSCTIIGLEKKGWIYTSRADFLVYVVDAQTEVKIYIINMEKLKKFFFPNMNKYPINQTMQLNRTKFSLIPWLDIKENVGYKLIQKEKICHITSSSAPASPA